MKIPRKVRVNGIDYTITREPVVLIDDTLVGGKVDLGLCEISLNTTRGCEAYNQKTLWHELMHIFTYNAGLDFGELEEKVMDTFAAGVNQVISDNPRMFKE